MHNIRGILPDEFGSSDRRVQELCLSTIPQQYECWTSWSSRRRQPKEDHLSLCSKVSLNEHCVTQCDCAYCAYTCPESVNPLLKAFCQNECNALIDTSCSATTSQYILCQHYTAISSKVVGKNVHATILKGNMGYDQCTVPDFVAVEPTLVAFL